MYFCFSPRGNFTQETALVDWKDFTQVVGRRFKELFLLDVGKRFDEGKIKPSEISTLVGLVKTLGQ